MDATEQIQKLTVYFGQFITPHKQAFMDRVLDNRTRYVTIVLEDIYQSQNASAVIRTCECLGLQDIHIIETRSSWSTNKQVLKGSNKWLDLKRYKEKAANNTAACFDQLRERGYRIAVTDPTPDGIPIHEVPLDRPLALVMGNEKHGSSPYALDQADLKVNIPMVGFTESFNISVSAAICLNSMLHRLRQSDYPWQLTTDQKDELRLNWYKKVVRRAELLEREFMRSIE